MTWKGYEQDKWSGKRSDKRWFPHTVDKNDVVKVEDELNEEKTLVFFEYNDVNGKINRIGNIGKATQRHIKIRIRNEQVLAPNWTREFVISPDKDGEDLTTIDFPVTVRDFYLIKDKGVWKTDSNTTITISDDPI